MKTSTRHAVSKTAAMSPPTARSITCFEPDLHQALRLRVAATRRFAFDPADEAACKSLAGDQENMAVFAQWVRRPNIREQQEIARSRSSLIVARRDRLAALKQQLFPIMDEVIA